MPEIEYGLTPYMFSIARRCKRFSTANDLIIHIAKKDNQDHAYVRMRLENGAKECGFKSFEEFFSMAKEAIIKKSIKKGRDDYPDDFVPAKYKRIATIAVSLLIGASIVIAVLLAIIVIF